MGIANSLIETLGIIIVALIGFATIVYQVRKSREENLRDHGMVMEKLTEVAEELQYLDEDLAVIDAKIDSHLQNDAVHRSKKTAKKK
jgi:hypothetical protein